VQGNSKKRLKRTENILSKPVTGDGNYIHSHDEDSGKPPRKAASRKGRKCLWQWYRRWTRCINCKGDNSEV